jgi:hypothetical protein
MHGCMGAKSCWRAGGGGRGHQNNFSGHTQKKFSVRIYKHSTKFFPTWQKKFSVFSQLMIQTFFKTELHCTRTAQTRTAPALHPQSWKCKRQRVHLHPLHPWFRHPWSRTWVSLGFITFTYNIYDVCWSSKIVKGWVSSRIILSSGVV